MTIPLFKPFIAESVVQSVAQTLRAGWISEGKKVKAFEERFCRHFHHPHALALNNGTAALHLAVSGAGVLPGDEVITTAQTFVATAMAILYCGARPVFADIQPGGPNIDPADVERKITPKTKAIIVVHYGGYPCDMDEINAIANRHKGISIIEDAAHALGSFYKERPVGSLGRFGIFSFQAIKQLTTGDGGMLCSRDEQDHQKAYRQRWFGIDRGNRKPSELGQPVWDISEVGYKYQMNDIAATMGLAQLALFDRSQSRRLALNGYYRAMLGSVEGLNLLEEKPDRSGACWLFTVRVERRLDFIRALKSRGVEAAVWHQRIDENSLFGGPQQDLPNQQAFNEQQVSIPLRDSLTDQEVEKILKAVKAGW
jgi:perosamine synthetase